MYFLIVLAVLCVVIFFVSAPLRRQRASRPADSTELANLDAARDAKYREIRDAELDHQTGKLSDEDYQAIDQTLRGEAIDILRALDRAHGQAPATIEQR
jgi:type II secretory pathway component PulM